MNSNEKHVLFLTFVHFFIFDLFHNKLYFFFFIISYTTDTMDLTAMRDNVYLLLL